MKLQSMHLIGSVVIMTCSLPQAVGAPAASQTLAPMLANGRPSGAPKPTGEVDGPKQRFTELVGMPVRNFQNEKLGRIKAITADLQRSRLVEVLVSTRSGLLGLHETITPVPATAFTVDTTREVALLNVSKARFEAATKLTRRNPAVYSQTERAAAASRYFGVTPWYVPVGLGHIETTGDIEQMQIKNVQGKYLGAVGRIFMDLPSGWIRQVVDDTESMAGSGSRILPQGSLVYNAKQDGLVLNENLAQLMAKPHFRWDEGVFGQTEFVEEIAPRGNAAGVRASGPVATARSRSSQPVRISAAASWKQRSSGKTSASGSHVATR